MAIHHPACREELSINDEAGFLTDGYAFFLA